MSVDNATPATQGTLCVLRRCTREDDWALAQIGAATFLETYAGWLPGRDILAHCREQHTATVYAELLDQPGTAAWCAEVNDAPVGYMLLTHPKLPQELVREGDVELKRIYLFSRFHATGIAQRMFTQAESHARQVAAGRILVGLHEQNTRALRFYLRQGFEEIGRRRFQMGGEAYDDPVLAKVLNGNGRP